MKENDTKWKIKSILYEEMMSAGNNKYIGKYKTFHLFPLKDNCLFKEKLIIYSGIIRNEIKRMTTGQKVKIN